MSHEAIVLEEGDTIYVGMMKKTGEYVEVRLCNTFDTLLVTDTEGSRQAG